MRSNVLRKTEGKNTLVKYIHRRVKKQRKNFLCLVVGQVGSGKSWTCISLAEQVDPTFNIERVVFSIEDFLKLINEGDSNGELKPGAAIVFDELGVGFAARNFYSQINRLMGMTLQTFRFRRFVVFFSVPSLHMIDKQARSLATAVIKTQNIDFETNRNNIKFYENVHDPMKGENYTRFLKVYHHGSVRRVKNFHVNQPGEKLREEYEVKHHKFKAELTKKYEAEIEAAKKKEEAKEEKANKVFDPNEFVELVVGNPSRYCFVRGGLHAVKTALLMADFNLSKPKADQIRELAMLELNKFNK